MRRILIAAAVGALLLGAPATAHADTNAGCMGGLIGPYVCPTPTSPAQAEAQAALGGPVVASASPKLAPAPAVAVAPARAVAKAKPSKPAKRHHRKRRHGHR